MNNISCSIIKDLLPLYVDDIVSEESKTIVENHLKDCESCRINLDKIKNEDINMEIDTDYIEKDGEKILGKIKKSQDKIKYTTIIFAMIVAVSNGWLSTGIMSTIPMIIIVPFILRLFFNESKIILFTAIGINLVIAIASGDFEFGLFSTPLIIVAVVTGIYIGKLVLVLKEDI